MNEPSSPLADGALSLVDLRSRGVTPTDIDPIWMDDMTNRLFTELKRELSQLENSKPRIEHDKRDASVRALNARTLDSLQRTLERLTKMEAQRADRRAREGALSPDEARNKLEPHILEIVARIRARRDPEGA
jgi:hypothetical protein